MLPNDLLPAIAAHLAQSHDYQTLLSLQLVSRFAWIVATPHIYRHVSLATDRQWQSLFGGALLSASETDISGSIPSVPAGRNHRTTDDMDIGDCPDGRERLRRSLWYVQKLEIRGLPPIGFDNELRTVQAIVSGHATATPQSAVPLLSHARDILLRLGEFPYQDLYTGSRETQRRLDTLARMFDVDDLISPKRLCVQGGYRCHHYRLVIQQMTRRWKNLREVTFHDTHINIVDQLYIPGVDNKLYLDNRQMASFSSDTEDRIKDAIECHAGREVTKASSWRLYGNPAPEGDGDEEMLAVSLARAFTSSSLAFVSTVLDKEGHGSRHVEETLKGWGNVGTRWTYTDSSAQQAPPCSVCYRAFEPFDVNGKAQTACLRDKAHGVIDSIRLDSPDVHDG